MIKVVLLVLTASLFFSYPLKNICKFLNSIKMSCMLTSNSLYNHGFECRILIKDGQPALSRYSEAYGNQGASCVLVGSVVEWLKRRARDQHRLGSKPTPALLLCPWERHFTAHSPAWRSWQAVLNYGCISINYKRTAIFWYLRKQVGVVAYPMY